MKIMSQYQPAGGVPPQERHCFWLTPKNAKQKARLADLTFYLKESGIDAGWCQFNDMVIITFPVK